MFNQANAYSNGQRIKLGVKYSNPEFWEVARFDFLEGKPFNEAHIRNRDNVVVISDKLRGQYLGETVRRQEKRLKSITNDSA